MCTIIFDNNNEVRCFSPLAINAMKKISFSKSFLILEKKEDSVESKKKGIPIFFYCIKSTSPEDQEEMGIIGIESPMNKETDTIVCLWEFIEDHALIPILTEA